jgi:hypothetical protein
VHTKAWLSAKHQLVPLVECQLPKSTSKVSKRIHDDQVIAISVTFNSCVVRCGEGLTGRDPLICGFKIVSNTIKVRATLIIPPSSGKSYETTELPSIVGNGEVKLKINLDHRA